jgi:hypothetical protein
MANGAIICFLTIPGGTTIRDLIFFSAVIALLGLFSAVRGEEAKPSPQGQLRLLISLGETTPTITRPREDQAAQQGGLIISCESMTFDQGNYVFKNGTLEIATGYISFAEIAVTFSGKSFSVTSSTPGKPLKEIHFRLPNGKLRINATSAGYHLLSQTMNPGIGSSEGW